VNYFEFYGGDYMRDTADLTLVEHGAFLMLLSTYYSTEKPLPVGDCKTQRVSQTEPSGFHSGFDPVFRIARAMTDDEKKAVVLVAERFFPIDPSDGLRHNARADRDIPKALERIEKSRVNGTKGGRPPKPKQNPAGYQNKTQRVSQTEPSAKAPHAPCSIKDQEQKPAKAAVDPRADLFERWKALPKSGGGAFLVKLLRDHKPEQRVFDAIELTMSETRVDPKGYVVGVLANKRPSDPVESAAAESGRLMKYWDENPGSAPWAGAE
jgi:uncharacterized protein YdaU (DUF1376 family)